jgi:hypothetical protein
MIEIDDASSIDNEISWLESKIDFCVDALAKAKTAQKREGEEIKHRDIEIHWRQAPTIEIQKDKLTATFRCSLHHK